MWWNNKLTVLFLFLCGCTLCTPASAQQDSVAPYDKGSHHLFFSANFDLNASSLTNDFIGQFYKGSYLTDELRMRNSNRMNDKNIAGYSLDGGMYYFFAPEDFKRKFGYYIGVEEHSFSEISFRKSFFDLVFFGNEAYSGQSVEFDDMELNTMAFQQLKAGIYKTFKRDRSLHQLGGAIGFNVGQRNQRIDVNQGSLFTQENGESVSLDLNMDIYKSDSNRTQIGSFNGYGCAIDLSYNFTDLKQNELQLRLTNIGYIRWDHAPDQFTRDTTIAYDGFDANIFDPEQPLFDENYGDSLVQEILGSDHQEAYVTRLPMEIDLIYTYRINGTRFSLTAEAKHKFFSVYRPFFSLSPGCHFNIQKSTLSIFPVVTYGGYGNWNFGMNLRSQINSKTFIGLGTSTLNSIINPRSTAGLSGFFTLYQSL